MEACTSRYACVVEVVIEPRVVRHGSMRCIERLVHVCYGNSFPTAAVTCSACIAPILLRFIRHGHSQRVPHCPPTHIPGN